MSEETTEEMEKMDEPKSESPDLDEIKGQVTHLHDTLDEIKVTGQQLQSYLRENASEIDDPQELQRVIQQASLLYERVERGDRNLVRGQ